MRADPEALREEQQEQACRDLLRALKAEFAQAVTGGCRRHRDRCQCTGAACGEDRVAQEVIR
jgi:hypothetical protein